MTIDKALPFVSVVVPVFNEESHIVACVESLLSQDYPFSSMEWIFVDGGSTDATVTLLEGFRAENPELIFLRSNPRKTVPYAMNIGIREARGEYIVRIDAHAEYACDYISCCIKTLGETGADNVGGVAVTKGAGFVGDSVAKMLSSKFGVGNSSFRTNGKDGYVDTVPFGAFRRDVFEKWGLYDERLTRNQDNELNYRIRSHGGKIYLSNRIKLSYYCRDSVAGILRMALQNGEWNVVTMRLCPGSMSARHFIPLAFVVSVLVLGALAAFVPACGALLLLELTAYFVLDAVFSVSNATGFKQAIFLFVLYPMFHVSYGIGSFRGLIRIAGKDFVGRQPSVSTVRQQRKG